MFDFACSNQLHAYLPPSPARPTTVGGAGANPKTNTTRVPESENCGFQTTETVRKPWVSGGEICLLLS